MADDERVFLRGINSETYGLDEQRRQQLAHPRVRSDKVITDDGSIAHSGDSELSRTLWKVAPGDPEFLTQSLQVHFVEIFPAGANHGHGHQNEACFYILEGHGYEIHDGLRYDWEKDDLVVVHNDSVHQHFNASQTERALCIVFKAKAMWMYLGLLQQGRAKAFEQPGFGDRRDWSPLWSPGVSKQKKVVKPADTTWRETPDGRVRVITSPATTDVRAVSVDVYEQQLEAGQSSTAHWHMADEVLYVLAGSGHMLQWQVEAEIADKYYARVAERPTRWDFSAGDTIYVPQNTVHQFFSDSSTETVRLLSAQNRAFKLLGYDNTVYLRTDGEQVLDVIEQVSSISK